jgi:peptidoglycan/xylan/chitin deacetylase (PgdA/CDA1 family)
MNLHPGTGPANAGLASILLALALLGTLLVIMVGPAGGPTASPGPSTASTAAGPRPSEPVGPASPGATATAIGSPSAGPSVAPTNTAEPIPTQAATAGPTPAPTSASTTAPTPRPTPHPTATVTPPATTAPASQLVRHGSRTGNDVALTFDMGGRVGDALAIMTWLVEHDVHATIFMTGAMAENTNTDAGRRVLAIIDQHPGLFTLGNHSYTHSDFRDLSAAQIRDELRRTEAAIARYCGQDPRPFFRPPSGGYDAGALAAIGAAGYGYSVLWDVDTIDWRPIVNDPPGPTADQIVGKVLANAQGGSIVLMHLGGYETFEALPRVVGGLRDRGFDLVNLDQLL